MKPVLPAVAADICVPTHEMNENCMTVLVKHNMYTHLYQGMQWDLLGLRLIYGERISVITVQFVMYVSLCVYNIATAVSYTHLDVYKRQHLKQIYKTYFERIKCIH